MATTFQTSFCLSEYYFPRDIQIRIVHKFLIVEACRIEGIKGINYSKYKFKTCKKLPQNLDIEE
jgi:hypothetical protein